MRRRRVHSFLVCLFWPLLSLGSEKLPERAVSFDWESIVGASLYDVELTYQKKSGGAPNKTQKFQTKNPEWAGRLRPGQYSMRLRARDLRKVPGTWSELETITVQLEALQLISPKLKTEIKATGENADLDISWKAVPGAISYQVVAKITGDTTETEPITTTTSQTQAQLQLSVARIYDLEVSAIGIDELKSDQPGRSQITIFGPRLELPKIEAPENKFVRELKWQSDTKSEKQTVSFFRKTKTGWTSVQKKQDLTESTIAIPAEWPGGTYRAQISSSHPLRVASKPSSMIFDLQNGDRSPASESIALIRNSIDRLTGWYLTFSYLFTGLTYTGSNSDNAAQTTIQVDLPQNLGGTGRIGLGRLGENSNWGSFSVIDLSGFKILDRTPTFASLESNIVYRQQVGELGELRLQGGVFARQTPEVIAKNNSEVQDIQNVSSIGPHLGAEYWWAVSPKIGVQGNAHIYLNLAAIKTPTGNPIATSLSYQLGFLGSYRWSKRITGLMGYAFRQDNQAYLSNNGKQNKLSLTGHYVNFFLEWGI
jgi:hypothetical protein